MVVYTRCLALRGRRRPVPRRGHRHRGIERSSGLDVRRLGNVVADGRTVWAEIIIRGHRADQTEQVLRGVMIFLVSGGVIRSGTFEMTEIRGHLTDGQVADWQVTVKIGFRLDDGGA